MSTEILLWVGFHIFVLAMLAMDLGLFHRKSNELSFREAIMWTVVWVVAAMLFNLGVYHYRGPEIALQFLAGYLVEQSLSVDNLFVFLLIFSYFKVPKAYQHKVLFWGILGAIVMRAGFIILGVALLKQAEWIIYVFGVILVISGIKLAFEKDKEIHPEKNPALKALQKIMPVLKRFHKDHFIVRRQGRNFATPLLVALLVVETTDLVFAVDSVPAVLAITRDPFIAYTSNIFAIMGLRSMFFVLAGVMDMFHYLHYGLAFILVFIGAKMLGSHFYKPSITLTLGVIAGVLLISVLASVLHKPTKLKSHGPSH